MANRIEWTDAFSVGVRAIDRDHRALVELANRALTSVHEEADAQTLAGTLEEMIECTVHHFSKEEHLMYRTAYPYYEHHRELHDALTRRALRYAVAVRHGRVRPGEVGQFLVEWLMEHIRDQDSGYGDHFRAHGIR